MVAQSSPDLQDRLPEGQNGANQRCSKSQSRSASREPAVHVSIPAEMEEDIQEVNEDVEEGPEIDANLAENWTKIIRSGLPADAKESLLKKYPVSKNCLLLRAPKINKEVLPVATAAAIKRDNLQMCVQNQIGTGLTALGQAISDLNSKAELKEDKEVVDILENLNEAAAILLDAGNNITKNRQASMLPELKKGARSAVADCKFDEFLYGNDFGDKVKNIKFFAKYKKARKGRDLEGHCENGEKRKHTHRDGERRKSKRLDHYEAKKH